MSLSPKWGLHQYFIIGHLNFLNYILSILQIFLKNDRLWALTLDFLGKLHFLDSILLRCKTPKGLFWPYASLHHVGLCFSSSYLFSTQSEAGFLLFSPERYKSMFTTLELLPTVSQWCHGLSSTKTNKRVLIILLPYFLLPRVSQLLSPTNGRLCFDS